jgi:hypothetical protein
MDERITASEAVYGFTAWLTTRKKSITLGAKHDVLEAADLADRWCRVNRLPPPRDKILTDNLNHPPSD